MNDDVKMIICFFDNVPMDVLGEYLKISPKDINNLYSDMIDNRSYFTYKKLAKQRLDTPLLANRLMRLSRRRGINVN